MNWEKQEGILLQTIPYLGNHRILKIFSSDGGLISLMVKHVSAKKAAYTDPFCKAEWIYRKHTGDIYLLKDATLLDPFLEIRAKYESIIAAGSMANDLLRSQLPQKRSQGLYELLLACLKHL